MSLYIARLTSVLVRTLWSLSKSSVRAQAPVCHWVWGIKMTESRRPFALTPDIRHPVCAYTHSHTFTHTLTNYTSEHTLWFSNVHSCSHVVLHTDIYAHTG